MRGLFLFIADRWRISFSRLKSLRENGDHAILTWGGGLGKAACMRQYHNKPMADLAAQLTAGLARLRKDYIDAAEALLQLITPESDYPCEFVLYRLTGFRAHRQGLSDQMMPGRSLAADLHRLILDICDSFPLATGDYHPQQALTIDAVAQRCGVSTKTVQRWRRAGLVARRMVFPDGKRRTAFLPGSIEWFVRSRHQQVARAARFSQMTLDQRDDIVRRARRMAAFANCTMADIARRLSARTGRAAETIRYTLRNHDRQNPSGAIFPLLWAPLDEKERLVIYHCFLSGVSAAALATKYRRSRGSIYRIISEVRARQLRSQEISYVYNPQFDLPNADSLILEPSHAPPAPPPPEPRLPAGQDVDDYFRDLYDVPLLDARQEADLFCRYNYLKHKADALRKRIDLNHVRSVKLKQVESLLIQANMVKNAIVRANLRLVVSIAKKHVGGPQNLFELISDGNISLMKAAEKFDFSRGFRFSTYASWAIMRNFARSVSKERYHHDRFATGNDEALDVAAGMGSYDPARAALGDARDSVEVLLAKLSPRERSILIHHYGLDQDGRGQTFDELGRQLGISKERVRQIEAQALTKLRHMAGALQQQAGK